MVELDVEQTTRTTMDTTVDTFEVSTETLESPEGADEIMWDNPDFSKWNGYYKKIPELKKAIDALAIWTCGKGWEADYGSRSLNNRTTSILESMIGNGKQNFQTIMEAHLVMKKINGDSYTQIIKNNDGELVNLKLLNPGRIKVVFGKDGVIKRYEQLDIKKENTIRTFQPEDILHSINEPIGDEIHGTSVVEACEDVILARNEAIDDWRKMLHRNLVGVRIIEVDEDDTDKLTKIKDMWEENIDKGEVLVVPRGTIGLPPTNTQNPENWIRYLEDVFYRAVGVPKIILGGASEYTEASSKIGYLTFDPVYSQEQLELEADLWNQVAIKVKFNRPAELGGTMQEAEEKNTGQLGFQPAEVAASATRTE